MKTCITDMNSQILALYTKEDAGACVNVFQSCQYVQPKLYALIFVQLHARQFFMNFGIDTQNQEYGFVDDTAVLPNFQDNTSRLQGIHCSDIDRQVAAFYLDSLKNRKPRRRFARFLFSLY